MLTSQPSILVLSTYTVSHRKILIFSNFRQNKHLTPTPRKTSYQLHSTLLTRLDTVSRMGYPWVAKMLQYFSYPLRSALFIRLLARENYLRGRSVTFSMYEYRSDNDRLLFCTYFNGFKPGRDRGLYRTRVSSLLMMMMT